MIRQSKKEWTHLLAAVLLYATALAYQGYQYGQGDQSQILPCLYAQDHPGAYANDHYVSQYLQSDINERSVFHLLFRYLGYEYPWLVWIWHVVLGTTLILAWLKIAGLGLRHLSYQCLAVAFILILGFHTSTGSNELYYNAVIPSLASKAVASWGLYFWLKENYGKWIWFLLLAGLLQPLVGLQLFLISFLGMTIHYLIKGKMKEMPWKPVLLFLFVMLPWLYMLARNNGSQSDPKTFMDIMEFRLSHHFFAGYFGWFSLLLASI